MLAKAPTNESLKIILAKLKSDHFVVRLTVIEELVNFRKYPQVKEVFIQAVKDEDEEVRGAAVDGLSYFDGEDVGEVVIACLDDPEELVRINAIETLESLSYKPAVKKLTNLLMTDKEELVRSYAAAVIGTLGGEHQKSLMKKRLDVEKSEQVRLGIMLGLCHLGEVEYLERILDFLYSPNYQVRCATINSLPGIIDERDVGFVLNQLMSLARTEETVAVLSSIDYAVNEIREAFGRDH
ncbi:HEAT repeat domain-containing protein [Kroppenstedtia pulmonis]|uniref:HEAT repeat domain-containing protein n=1 Tax=Kroppenstedtia pulmonis TaxID=1380685 RepID=A0A7D4BGT8_9BACL|nr:HEAT repeat domain-containing protein [Kroppenstedtia pulmonis]QKG85332.1 HEAT repeat domain-containing protein [Kroppenstedtia pulmonis]